MSLQGIVMLDVEVSFGRPDVAEFWRDLDATTRLYNPNEQDSFVVQLVMRRARLEANDFLLRSAMLTATEASQWVQQREAELLRECSARGYLT